MLIPINDVNIALRNSSTVKPHLKNRRGFTIFDTNGSSIKRREERFGDRNIEPVLKNPVPQVASNRSLLNTDASGLPYKFFEVQKILCK